MIGPQPTEAERVYIEWMKDAAMYEKLLDNEHNKIINAGFVCFCIGIALGAIFG